MAYQTFQNVPFQQQQYPYQQQYYPTQTQPYQYQQPQQPSQPAQQNNLVIPWVRGVAAAESYHVEPGQTVMLLDSEAPADKPVIYMVSADSTGRPLPVDTYDLVKRVRPSTQIPDFDPNEFVRRSEIEDIIIAATTKAVEQKMSEMQFKATPTKQERGNH